MGLAESRNDRFYQLCGLGKTHLVEKMLEADKELKTININWQNFEVLKKNLFSLQNYYKRNQNRKIKNFSFQKTKIRANALHC